MHGGEIAVGSKEMQWEMLLVIEGKGWKDVWEIEGIMPEEDKWECMMPTGCLLMLSLLREEN